MTIRELVTKWGFEVEHDKLDKLEGQLESIKHRLDIMLGVEMIKGVVEFTERFAEFAEQLHVASQSAGITVEAFQRLAFAASKSGISQEQMGQSMARLARHLYEAKTGSAEAQLAFSRAGFTTDQIHSFKTGSDVMGALADRFKDIHDPIQKQALAMQLMGRGSVNMVAFLSQGSAAIKGMGAEADRLGIILGEKQVNALVTVSHAFKEVFGVIKSVSAFIAAEFAPSITYVIKSLLGWWEANQKIIKTQLHEWIYRLLFSLGAVWEAFRLVGLIVFDLAKKFMAWLNLHPELKRFVVLTLEVIGAMLVLKKAADVLSPAFGVLKFVFSSSMIPLLAWVAVAGLLAVAIHDLWAAVHGKPTWIQAFLDFIGIGKEVNDIFMNIFQAVDDLLHLRINDFFKDIAKQIMDVVGVILKLPGGVFKIFEKIGEVATTAAPSVASSVSSSISNATVNAPITMNIPSGANPKEMAEAARDGVSEHLDRHYRQAQRSLAGNVAY